MRDPVAMDGQLVLVYPFYADQYDGMRSSL